MMVWNYRVIVEEEQHGYLPSAPLDIEYDNSSISV